MLVKDNTVLIQERSAMPGQEHCMLQRSQAKVLLDNRVIFYPCTLKESQLTPTRVSYSLTVLLPGDYLNKMLLIQGAKQAVLALGCYSVLFYKIQFLPVQYFTFLASLQFLFILGYWCLFLSPFPFRESITPRLPCHCSKMPKGSSGIERVMLATLCYTISHISAITSRLKNAM